MKEFKKKKVLIILASPFYLDKGSCVRARSDIIAWANSFKNIDLLTYPVGNDIPIINVNHIRANIPFYKKISAGPSISKIYADILLFFNSFALLLKNNYDIVIGEDFEGSFIAMLISKLFGKVHIYSMHNPLVETVKPYTKNKGVLEISKWMDDILERNSPNIVLEREFEYERIKKLYPKKNITFVPDAFPTDRKEVKGFDDKEYIFYSGNFKEYQGIDLLLESFKEYIKKNKDIYLVLAGDKYNQMEDYAKELGIGNRVVFTGSLSLVETNYMIYNSLFCVLPRIVDGPPGMKALHYFSQGKAILGTDLSCNKKVIEDNRCGYLVDPNVEEFSKGIDRMVRDIGFRNKLEEYIKKKGIGSQEKANEGIVKLLDNLVSE